MKFRSKKQQAAVMAKLRNASYPQLQSRGVQLRPHSDTDGDGIKNKMDCRPLDPKRQGWLHDQTIKHLKKQEEKLERKREKEQKKLSDLRDELKVKQTISGKEAKIKQVQLREKQAVIDELQRERRQADKLKKANEQVKAELDKYTLSGKAKTVAKKAWEREKEGARIVGRATAKGAKAAAGATAKWWKSPQGKAQRKAALNTSAKILKKTAGFLGYTEPRPRRRRKRR